MNQTLNVRALAASKAKGQRPFFFEDPQAERVLCVAMALAQELAVTRERLDTIERLLSKGEPVTRRAIDGFKPDDVAMAERQQAHADFLARVLRIYQQSREAFSAGDESTDTLAAEFAAERDG